LTQFFSLRWARICANFREKIFARRTCAIARTRWRTSAEHPEVE